MQGDMKKRRSSGGGRLGDLGGLMPEEEDREEGDEKYR